MAYTTINKSTDYFNTKLYTGNGSTQSITGVGFQPDFVWLKQRSSGVYYHRLQDAVRGAGKVIYSNRVDAQGDFGTGTTGSIRTFDTDGFSLGSELGSNQNNTTMASWNWKANGTGSSNTDGDITSTVSANTTSGFSIVKWTGNGSNDQRIGHGLGARPTWWMIKRLTADDDWIVYHQGISSNWYDDTYMYLNENFSVMGSLNTGTGNPTSSVFYVGSDGKTNANGQEYIAYVFAEKPGFSKFGNYTPNNNDNGPFVYTGFKPTWIMIKSSTPNGYNWMILDTVRQPLNLPNGVTLQADVESAEFDYAPNGYVDFLSNGFKLRSTSNGVNGAGSTNYIYCAFGQTLVGSNNVPATAR